MARSNYQSARKDWGEMYEHELVECAAELDGMIDDLIAADNKSSADLAAANARIAELESALKSAVCAQQEHAVTIEGMIARIAEVKAERDRLAKENAEFRRRLDTLNPSGADELTRLKGLRGKFCLYGGGIEFTKCEHFCSHLSEISASAEGGEA